jgi:hypothetical protein
VKRCDEFVRQRIYFRKKLIFFFILASALSENSVHLSTGILSNTFPPELGTYVTFRFVDSDCTIALAASIFRKATNASPALSNARDIVAAASASPSARITAACRSCSAYSRNHQFLLRLPTLLPRTFSTINLARSASTTHI